MIAQSFNKEKYTRRKIIQCEHFQVKLRVIPTTEVEHKKRYLLWMDDEDLDISIKDQTKKIGQSK